MLSRSTMISFACFGRQRTPVVKRQFSTFAGSWGRLWQRVSLLFDSSRRFNVEGAAKAMPRIGVVALRFNFRGVGRSAGTFDAGAGEKDDFKAAIAFVSERYPDLPIWAAGMSFGSWIGMTAGAEDARVSLLLGIAPPVDRYDFEILKTSTLPKFIVHGEADELISIKDVRKFYSQIPEPKELVTIEDANHLFEGKTSMVGEAVEDLLADFNTVKA